MARRSSKIDASVRRSCKAVYTTFFADVLIQHQQDPDLRISSLKRLRLENLESNILNWKDCPDPRSKIQDVQKTFLGSRAEILDPDPRSKIQDFQKTCILCKDVHMYVYIYVDIYLYMHKRINFYVYVNCVFTYIYKCAFICTPMSIYVFIVYRCTCIYIYIYICKYMYII